MDANHENEPEQALAMNIDPLQIPLSVWVRARAEAQTMFDDGLGPGNLSVDQMAVFIAHSAWENGGFYLEEVVEMENEIGRDSGVEMSDDDLPAYSDDENDAYPSETQGADYTTKQCVVEKCLNKVKYGRAVCHHHRLILDSGSGTLDIDWSYIHEPGESATRKAVLDLVLAYGDNINFFNEHKEGDIMTKFDAAKEYRDYTYLWGKIYPAMEAIRELPLTDDAGQVLDDDSHVKGLCIDIFFKMKHLYNYLSGCYPDLAPMTQESREELNYKILAIIARQRVIDLASLQDISNDIGDIRNAWGVDWGGERA